jgi:subtilase family serine protease
MKQTLRTRRAALAFLAIAVAATVAMLSAASSSHATVASHAVSPAIKAGSGKPLVSGPQRMTGGSGANSVSFSCQTRPINGSAGLKCYEPQQIQTAYGYSGLLSSGVDGSGKTIVIIDAFQSPYIQSDLAIQDATFGLPTPNFTQIAPEGLTPFDPNDGNQDGWAEEITLDVLWAHAMAPGANIVLALAPSNQDADLLATTKYVVQHHIGDVISQSFGEAEQCMDPSLLAQQHAVFRQATREGYSIFASSGDSGASQFNCDGTAAIEAASTPASDPNVTGVGGTTLDANGTTGKYVNEKAWTEILGCNPPALDFPADVNCSGGGFSTIYRTPGYQRAAEMGYPATPPGAGRGVPDVAYNAGVNGGVLTHCGICNLLNGLDPLDPTIFFLFGGTSAGSPQWAALTADADQMAGHDIGNINPTLYALAHTNAFHDVNSGNNIVAEIGSKGFHAGPGWDAVTGLGSPNAAQLLPTLAGS